MRLPILAPACLLLSLCACAPDGETPQPASSSPYSVRDGFVRDAEGRAVILRGVNLSGMHKNAPYLDFHAPEDFRLVRDGLGMNSLRFLIEWSAVEPTRGAYDDAYLDAVRERMDWARDAGLLVVLDMHQDLFGEGFAGGNGAPPWACDAARYAAYEPSEMWFLGYLEENVVACFDGFWNDTDLQDHYAKAYRHVAERLSDHPAIIGFDVMNEPWLGSYSIDDFEPRALQPFYERVVPQVRAAAPHWLAFLEPMSLSNLGRATRLEPFPFDDVVYAPHSYDNSAEQGEGFDAAKRDGILTKLQTLKAEAHALGAALWIGEYGGVADHPGITPYMDAEYDAFASVFAGSTYWDFSRGDGYGISNADGSEKPALWDVLVRPSPERIAGTPGSWAYDETTGTFTLSWLAAGVAPSLVHVPARAYPAGFVVDVSGGSAVVDGADVAVSAEAGSDVVVVVRPL
ncbi:MAG: cellulase family glycosylhydrolase [Deltaproteobacteria bacterium]|nr:cellulase family glycosylhydrolase [Deltaproteobacteria bacterium]